MSRSNSPSPPDVNNPRSKPSEMGDEEVSLEGQQFQQLSATDDSHGDHCLVEEVDPSSRGRRMEEEIVELVYGGNISAACEATNAVARPQATYNEPEHMARKLHKCRMNAQSNRDRKKVMIGMLGSDRDQLIEHNSKLKEENEVLRRLIGTLRRAKGLSSNSQSPSFGSSLFNAVPTFEATRRMFSQADIGRSIFAQSPDTHTIDWNRRFDLSNRDQLVGDIGRHILHDMQVAAPTPRFGNSTLLSQLDSMNGQSSVVSLFPPSMINSTRASTNLFTGWATESRVPSMLHQHRPVHAFDDVYHSLSNISQQRTYSRDHLMEGNIAELVLARNSQVNNSRLAWFQSIAALAPGNSSTILPDVRAIRNTFPPETMDRQAQFRSVTQPIGEPRFDSTMVQPPMHLGGIVNSIPKPRSSNETETFAPKEYPPSWWEHSQRRR
jgi:hypothetical protein